MINVIETIRRWHRLSNAAFQLSKFDDHLLADIGLVRGNLENAARRIL